MRITAAQSEQIITQARALYVSHYQGDLNSIEVSEFIESGEPNEVYQGHVEITGTREGERIFASCHVKLSDRNGTPHAQVSWAAGNGTGAPSPCGRCSGSGVVPDPDSLDTGTQPCPACNGARRVDRLR